MSDGHVWQWGDDYPEYADCLELAGAKVYAYERFGSYQGDWWALIRFNGKRLWIHGYYGSCSVCDALQGVDWSTWNTEEENLKAVEGLRALGVDALDDGEESFDSDESALARAGENIEWDMDAPPMVEFIKANAGKGHADAS